MKAYFKPLGFVILAVIGSQQIHATAPSINTIYSTTEVRTTGPHAPFSFNITSEAEYLSSGAYAGDYEYIYKLPEGTPPIDVFTVYFDATPSIEDVLGTHSFTGNINTHNVSWTHIGDIAGSETLTFVSPEAPTWGFASAQDGDQWTDYNNGIRGDNGVVVPDPPVPDAGTTACLLGGALLGLGMIRRKVVS